MTDPTPSPTMRDALAEATLARMPRRDESLAAMHRRDLLAVLERSLAERQNRTRNIVHDWSSPQ